LAVGREVIVSRGELVEIGGGFRVPDVMAQSGAVLREVGTTNKTRAADYAAAISERTALILRVHPSNFTIEGFTERPTLADLVAIGRKFNIPVAEDLGSGNLSGTDPGTVSDPTVAATIAAGVDVCCFSGDKLLGGPQAGIIVGGTALVDRIRKHPLMRALRVDKMTYAALEAAALRRRCRCSGCWRRRPTRFARELTPWPPRSVDTTAGAPTWCRECRRSAEAAPPAWSCRRG
jgi:L-seryl-tRNA(Ser) seleniumtransferase